ncbi:MAG: hypothetical protein K2K73_02715 [Ureaplasma sp.]|nr:hypothetical protein [Ureaplasma sp.]
MFLIKDIINELNKVSNNRPGEYLISSVDKIKIDENRYSIEIHVMNLDQTDKKTLVIKVKE